MKIREPESNKNPASIDGLLLLLILSLLVACSPGCSSTKPPAPAPPAVRMAEQAAAQADELSRQQNWPAAARLGQLAADRFSLLNDQAGEAIALHNLAQAQRELGQEREAVLLLEKAAGLNQKLGRTNEWWRNQIALLQLEFQHPEAAASRFATLLPQVPLSLDQSTQALFLNELGLWQTRQLHFAQADESFAQANKRFQASHDLGGLAAVQANRAQLKEEQKDYAEATRLWREALQKFQLLTDAPGIARALSGQGRSLLFSQTDLPHAEELLRRATHNFHLLRSPREEAAARNLWVQCQRAQGKASPSEADDLKSGIDQKAP